MRVLYFAPKECWPTTTGASLRNYHLARILARSERITYLAFSDAAAAMDERGERQSAGNIKAVENSPPGASEGANPNEDGPARWFERVIIVPQERCYTPTKLLRGALGRTPVTVLNYTNHAMAAKLDRVLSAEDFDLVQVESIHLVRYLPMIRKARNSPLIVCDWHNIESDLMLQYSRTAANPLRSAYARRTASQLAAFEQRMALAADANVMVSEQDRARLLAFAPSARSFVIENGVDVSYYSDENIEKAYATWSARHAKDTGTAAALQALERRDGRNRVLFVGSMDYHANVDGAVKFTRSVWPRVHELLPNVVLTIVGRNPTPEVRALAELQAVEVTGTVDDIRPYYREAFASVVPLNVGGGSRLKICEGMAAGVPLVSTRLGAEGIDAKDGQSITLAETTEEFCEAINDLAHDGGKWNAMAAAGRELVSAKYDWAILGEQLAQIHRELVERQKG